MVSVTSMVMISRLLTTVLTLGLLGVGCGLVAAAMVTKRSKDGAAPKKQDKKKPDAETKRQLAQLKEQRRSGLLTKEEYRAKREFLWKE